MTALRFLHTADLHLGSRLQAGAPEADLVRQAAEEATYRALERIVSATIDTQAEFLIVAGDLYDQHARSVRAQVFAAEQFNRLRERGIPVFIVHGNHDPLQADFAAWRLPDNVTVFGSEEVAVAEVRDRHGRLRATVAGISYQYPREPRRLVGRYPPAPEPVPHIAVLHTALDPNQTAYAPCSIQDLCAQPGIDYWALGHQHAPEVRRAQAPAVVFPGIPQGRDVGESGPAGCVLVAIDASRRVRLEFIPIADVLWSVEAVDLGESGRPPAADLADVYSRLAARAEALLARGDDTHELAPAGFPAPPARPEPPSRAVRWLLTGSTPAHADLHRTEEAVTELLARLRAAYACGRPFLWSESIVLRTAPVVGDLAQLRQTDPVIGMLFAVAEESLQRGSAWRAELRKKAGDVWTEPRPVEEQDPRRLDLSEEELDDLIAAARDLALGTILEMRG